jgi:tRNA-binding EMAP/Myf-like protein
MFNWIKNLFGKKDKKPAGCCGGGCCAHVAKMMPFDFGVSDEDRMALQAIDDLVVIGKVMEMRSHSNEAMTKVKVTMCDLGSGEIVQILCGGVNLEEGQIVPVARVNAVLPGDFGIGERDIRGEMSLNRLV